MWPLQVGLDIFLDHLHLFFFFTESLDLELTDSDRPANRNGGKGPTTRRIAARNEGLLREGESVFHREEPFNRLSCSKWSALHTYTYEKH